MLTKYPLCIHQDHAMGCYDRIIRSHTILNSHKPVISNIICKINSIVHDLIQFRIQINNNISKTTYSNTAKLICHGAGQGAGNGDTNWTFISIPMIVVVEAITRLHHQYSKRK